MRDALAQGAELCQRVGDQHKGHGPGLQALLEGGQTGNKPWKQARLVTWFMSPIPVGKEEEDAEIGSVAVGTAQTSQFCSFR